MAVYNAWVDRVPILMFAGNGLDATKRRPGTEWSHSVQDPALLLRDFLKWDDYPMSLQHFAESTVRAVLATLCAANADLEQAIFDEHGNVHPHVRIMVNGHDIALARGLDTPVTTTDEIAIFPPIGGGREI